MDEGAQQMSAPLSLGAQVRVRVAYPPGHTRAPYFTRGKVGVIADTAGVHRNPEEVAYGIYNGAKLHVYRVCFRQADLWDGYQGPPLDTLYVDVYENWLEPATAEKA